MAKKKSPYTGLLAEPIVVPSEGRLMLMEGVDAGNVGRVVQDYVKRQHFTKLLLLFDYYKIPPVTADGELNLLPLVMALANEHVPGMRVVTKKPRGTGPENEWLGEKGLRLWVAVERRRRQGKTIKEATDALSRLSVFMGKKRSLKSLKSRFMEVQKNHPVFLNTKLGTPERKAVEVAIMGTLGVDFKD